MTKLFYIVTTPKGVYEVASLAKAKEIIAKCGGSYKPSYKSVITY